jgi:hypothetical protein
LNAISIVSSDLGIPFREWRERLPLAFSSIELIGSLMDGLII